MKRTLIIALLTATAALSNGAQGALRNVENAYEVMASAVVLPDAEGGQLILHPCPTCKTVFLSTDVNTRYQLSASGAPMKLAQFRELAGKNQQALTTVIYRLDNKLVTHIVLSAK
jgi:hypothetical protein